MNRWSHHTLTPRAPAWQRLPSDLRDGDYTATIVVNQPYRALLDIPDAWSTATVRLSVRTIDAPQFAVSGPRTETPTPFSGSRPTGRANPPTAWRPDLRALPAWRVQIGGSDGGDGRNLLAFSATIWDAGTSPLVVDGFRRSGQDIMDAYQYFFDASGRQVGYAPAGTMEWDPRDGHQHWHFTDFARYRLLDETMHVAVRSGKESFCLANTHAIDYTLPFANWQPDNTDLHTACGDSTALAVRQVLDVGSGDTYAQDLPGQAFDITDLPNGVYFIEIAANPEETIYELDSSNNTSLRRIVLGGEPGARTVEVPPYTNGPA